MAPGSASPDPSRPAGGTADRSGGVKLLGEVLEGVSSTVDGDGGNVLVPLFPITDRLGVVTTWDADEQKAIIRGEVTIWVGRDYHINRDGETVTFGPPPELIDDTLYVPITYFEHVIVGYKATVEDGYVVIERFGRTMQALP